MPNYQNTIIYKLINYDCPEHVYVGSTTNWVKRKQLHKHSVTNPLCQKYSNKKYVIIRENGGWENWNMIKICDFPCNNKREAEQEEDRHMLELKANMNMCRAYLTDIERKEKKKEYYKDNKETIKEKKKEYYKDNKEKILERNKKYRDNNKDEIFEKQKEKMTCDCGGCF